MIEEGKSHRVCRLSIILGGERSGVAWIEVVLGKGGTCAKKPLVSAFFAEGAEFVDTG